MCLVLRVTSDTDAEVIDIPHGSIRRMHLVGVQLLTIVRNVIGEVKILFFICFLTHCFVGVKNVLLGPGWYSMKSLKHFLNKYSTDSLPISPSSKKRTET